MDLTWKHPFSAIVAGPSGSGKSRFVARFLEHADRMCDTRFARITWHYGSGGGGGPSGDDPDSSRVRYATGLPDLDDYDGSEPALVIVDDMMREADSRVSDLFTKGSHHRNMSVFFITQNLFHQGRGQRDISLNAHYIVCFKNPRDRAQIKHLARQLYPENSKYVEEAYNDATREPHGYLLIDLKQSTPDEMRLRSAIFPDDPVNYVYLPKKQ
jgi:hypothetical protein